MDTIPYILRLIVCSYEPELFPGLIYRMVKPRIVLLIFVSGKVVLTGQSHSAVLISELCFVLLAALTGTTFWISHSQWFSSLVPFL